MGQSLGIALSVHGVGEAGGLFIVAPAKLYRRVAPENLQTGQQKFHAVFPEYSLSKSSVWSSDRCYSKANPRCKFNIGMLFVG